MEVCHRVATTCGFAWRTFTDALFHFRTGPTRRGHSRRSSALRGVRSLSLSVNLKSNYTRLRSQAVTQFVVIPGASILASVRSPSNRERTTFR